MTIGVAGEADFTYGQALLWKGLRVSFTVMAEARHFMQALDFLSSRKKVFPFEKMLSNTFNLEGTTEALRGMASFKEIKPVILPHSKN